MAEAPAVNTAGDLAAVAAAWAALDPVFRDSPQFCCEPLAAALDVELVLKVETLNPLRSFKGRGTETLVRVLVADAAAGGGAPLAGLVCASAGNFGQGLAYACRKRGLDLEVFAAESASPLKLERMRRLGATVTLAGADFDAAKDVARRAAAASGRRYIEDGREPAITLGAATIAHELGRWAQPFAAVLVPVGNGALINGVGGWLKQARPATRVVGVVAAAAPAMALSWQARQPITTASAATIADGVAVRTPVPAAVVETLSTVDEYLQVSEEAIERAMRLVFAHAGIAGEPAGVLGVAALLEHAGRFTGQRLATPLCGGNLTPEQARRWLL